MVSVASSTILIYGGDEPERLEESELPHGYILSDLRIEPVVSE